MHPNQSGVDRKFDDISLVGYRYLSSHRRHEYDYDGVDEVDDFPRHRSELYPSVEIYRLLKEELFELTSGDLT